MTKMTINRYVTRAAIVFQPDAYEQQILGGETVYEPEQPAYTGLVDSSGLPLYRVTNRISLGFDLTWRSRKS